MASRAGARGRARAVGACGRCGARGAGLGLLTLAALERIGDGWVIAVDSSVGALEELLQLAHEANANGIMYLVGDAEVARVLRADGRAEPTV